MDDVYINDPRQNSAKNRAQALKKVIKKRRIAQYMADLFIFPLIIFLFLGINFSLFAQSGSYSIFDGNLKFNLEAVYIFIAIAVFAVVINFLFSISRKLQNLIVSLVAGFFVYALLKQFAQFEEKSILDIYFGEYIAKEDIRLILSEYSDIIISVLFGLITFLIIAISSRAFLFYLVILLLLIEGGIILSNFLNPTRHEFETTSNNIITPKGAEEKENTRLIYFGFPGLTTHLNIKNFADQNKNTLVTQTADNLLGFLYQNNFKFWQNSFVDENNAHNNLLRTFNPQDLNRAISELTPDNVNLDGFWNFGKLNKKTLYFKSNEIFSHFKDQNYTLKAYEFPGIEMCRVNNHNIVSKCVKKQSLPINFQNLNLSTFQKTILLTKEWLDSAGHPVDLSFLDTLIKMFFPKYSIKDFNFSTENLDIINAFQVFDIMAQDINADIGSNAYFAVINLPSDTYLYDSLCNLKPVSEWVGPDNKDIMKKRRAYLEQTNCLIGQLENFLQKLANNNKLSQSTIIIQGLNNPKVLSDIRSQDFYTNMRTQKSTLTAIFDPKSALAELKNDICLSQEIIGNYINQKEGCTPYKEESLDEKSVNEITKKYQDDNISQQEMENANHAFIKWYQDWAKANGVDNNLKEIKATPAPKTEEEKEVAKAPASTTVKNEVAEAKTESLGKAKSKSTKTTKTEKTNKNTKKQK